MDIAHSNEYRRFICKKQSFGYRIWFISHKLNSDMGKLGCEYSDSLLNYIKR